MDNKKYGLLTIHDTQNYGSLLQAYSLYAALQSMGMDIELIDYRNKKISDREKPITDREVKSLKDIIKKIMWGPSQKSKYENIWNFIEENMKRSRIYTRENIEEANQVYDVFITGSDIVWGTEITGGDMSYFLDFTSDDKRRVAISSSVGTLWKENEISQIRQYLLRYNKISVREQIAADWIETLIGKNIPVTCDPTMLWESGFWENMEDNSNVPSEKYVLIYAVNPDKKNIIDGIRYAKKRGYVPYFINFYTPVKGTKTIRPVTVQQWIGLIANAKAVFSASYHGLLFSLYFHRPVFYYNRGERSRMISLAKELDIFHREGILDYVEKDIPIDYKAVDQKIQIMREDSWNVIRSIMEEVL